MYRDSTYRNIYSKSPKIDASVWPACHLAAAIHDRGWRSKRGEEEEERKRGCDEGMWSNGHPFIRLSGTLVVTETVSVDSLMSIGGFMLSCTLEFIMIS